MVVQKTKFNYSVTSTVILAFALIIPGLSLAIFGLTVPPVSVEFVGIFFIEAALGMYVVVKRLTAHVRKASFCDDSFRVVGWRFKKEYAYSQVDDVILVNGPIRGRSITISVGTDEDPLVLFKNPKSHKAGTDLYTWLKQKCPQARSSIS